MLQGNIDSFPVPDVLRMLAANRRHGSLRLVGDRGPIHVEIAAGKVVAGAIEGVATSELADVVVALLRTRDGNFSFVAADETPGTPGASQQMGSDVESLLVEAEFLVAEWEEVEDTVPDLDRCARLTTGISGDSVTLDPDEWSLVARIGHRSHLGDLRDQLGLTPLEAAKAVQRLVTLGVVEVLSTEAAMNIDVGEWGTTPQAAAPQANGAPEETRRPALAGAFNDSDQTARVDRRLRDLGPPAGAAERRTAAPESDPTPDPTSDPTLPDPTPKSGR